VVEPSPLRQLNLFSGPKVTPSRLPSNWVKSTLDSEIDASKESEPRSCPLNIRESTEICIAGQAAAAGLSDSISSAAALMVGSESRESESIWIFSCASGPSKSICALIKSPARPNDVSPPSYCPVEENAPKSVSPNARRSTEKSRQTIAGSPGLPPLLKRACVSAHALISSSSRRPEITVVSASTLSSVSSGLTSPIEASARHVSSASCAIDRDRLFEYVASMDSASEILRSISSDSLCSGALLNGRGRPTANPSRLEEMLSATPSPA